MDDPESEFELTPPPEPEPQGTEPEPAELAEVPLAGRRGHRYTPDERLVKVRRISELRALGQSVVEACRSAGVTYASYRKWEAELGDRVPATKPAPPEREPMARVPVSSGVAKSPYLIELDVRDLVRANRAAVVAALTVGKHEQVKAAILGLLES